MQTKHTFNPFLFLLGLRFAAAADGGAGGGSGTGDGSGQNAGGATGDEAEVKMKQGELNRMMAERAARGGEAAVAKLLEGIGVKSPDELKAALTKLRETEAAQLTDLQKAQKEAADLKTAKEQADKAAADTLAKANERLMRGAVLALAGQFNDPADAWAHVDRSKLKVGEDGEVTGAKEAVDALLKAKPYLLKSQQAQPRGTPRSNATQRPTGDGNEPPVQRKSRLKF